MLSKKAKEREESSDSLTSEPEEGEEGEHHKEEKSGLFGIFNRKKSFDSLPRLFTPLFFLFSSLTLCFPSALTFFLSTGLPRPPLLQRRKSRLPIQ
jgi:hypothetical protein